MLGRRLTSSEYTTQLANHIFMRAGWFKAARLRGALLIKFPPHLFSMQNPPKSQESQTETRLYSQVSPFQN
jgi:hypothetical protein